MKNQGKHRPRARGRIMNKNTWRASAANRAAERKQKELAFEREVELFTQRQANAFYIKDTKESIEEYIGILNKDSQRMVIANRTLSFAHKVIKDWRHQRDLFSPRTTIYEANRNLAENRGYSPLWAYLVERILIQGGVPESFIFGTCEPPMLKIK